MQYIPQLLLITLAAILGVPPLTAQTDREKSVLEANHAYDRAILSADRLMLERIYLDDFIFTGSDGQTRTKEQQIQYLTSGSIQILDAASDDIHVKLYGDVAILTGCFRGRAKTGNKEFSFVERYSTVWVSQADKWRLALEHSTVLK